MPIDFAEPAPRSGRSTGNATGNGDTGQKAHAVQLEGHAVPELVRKVGDIKSGRITLQGVEDYLDRHTLVWDRDLLRKMFQEADYKKEASLDYPSVVAALSGRFPKRKLTGDWRKLAAILLGLPVLVLAEDQQRISERVGVANDFWNLPPKPLPPVKRRVRSRGVTGEWEALSSCSTAGALLTSCSGNGMPLSGPESSYGIRNPHGASSSGAGGRGDSLTALLGGSGGACGLSSKAAAGVGEASALLARNHRSPPGVGGSGIESEEAVVLTSGGLKQVALRPVELAINGSLAEAGRMTFAAVQEFEDFSRGQQMSPALRMGAAMSVALPATRGQDIPTSLASPPKPTRAWKATLPPSAITLPPSALGTLRQSIRSTATTKPQFETQTVRLTTDACDLKKTLGLHREDLPLSRVEPVRDTKTLYNADYTTWGGTNTNDRTAPSRWYNDHPASATVGTVRKYPWG